MLPLPIILVCAIAIEQIASWHGVFYVFNHAIALIWPQIQTELKHQCFPPVAG
jgi:hypothetical protein